MNWEWRQGYPAVFGSLSWYDTIGMITPFWGVSDEISLYEFTNGAIETAAFYQVSQHFKLC